MPGPYDSIQPSCSSSMRAVGKSDRLGRRLLQLRGGRGGLL